MSRLSRWAAAAVTGLSLVAGPAAAQDFEPGQGVRFDPAPLHMELDEVARRSALSALLNTVSTGVLAWVNGQDPVESALKALPIHVGNEAVRTLDWTLAGTDYADNPIPNVTGRLANSALANIVAGRPLCEDLQTEYLPITFTYDCGEVSVGFTAEPLVYGGWALAMGGELDVESTLRFGVPVTRYTHDEAMQSPFGSLTTDRERIRTRLLDNGDSVTVRDSYTAPTGGVAFGGAMAYFDEQPFENEQLARRYLAMGATSEERAAHAHLQQLVDGWDAYRAHRIDETQDHEMRHILQQEYFQKLSEALGTADWTDYDIERLGSPVSFRVPLGSIALHSLGTLIPYETRPWEFLARTHGSHILPTDAEGEWFGRNTDGTPYFGR